MSPRTFYDYFASREEAIVEAVMEHTMAMPDALAARPAGEPAWESLAQVLPDALAAALGDRDNIVLLLRIARENPAVPAHRAAI